MVEERERLSRAVEGLRAQRSPDPEARARVLAAVHATIGGPPGGGPEGGGGTAGSGSAPGPITLGWVAKSVAATLALAGASLTLLTTGASAWTAEPEPLARADHSRDEAPALEPSVEPSLPASPAQPAVLVTEARADPAPPRPSPRARAGSLEPKPTPDSRDSLARELALLDAAREASSPRAALASLDRHAREFPGGMLTPERDALRAIALCELDRVDEARTITLAWLAEHPASPFRDQLRDRCPALRSDLEG